jgi:hypothetical protein
MSMHGVLRPSKRKRFAIALAAIAASFFTMPSQILAEPIQLGYLIPTTVFLFNDNVQLVRTIQRMPTIAPIPAITVASVHYNYFKRHRLTINYSSTGAIVPADPSNPAFLVIGCHIDGHACIGSSDRLLSLVPPIPGWVEVMTCDYPTCASNSPVNYVWFSEALDSGTHDVVIEATVQSGVFPLIVSGGGILLNDARNLVVTVMELPIE